MNETDLKKKLIEYGLKIKNAGLIAGTWGNLSIKYNENIMITPSGIEYDKLTIDDIMICDINGNVVKGDRIPSSELPTHIAIYKQRTDIKSIIHIHSIYATAIAAARKSIPAIVEDMAMIIGGEIPCAKYAPPGSEKLAQNILEVLEKKYAILLANHGAIGLGTDIEEAFLVCEILEKSAQIYLFSSQIGLPKPLAIEDVENMRNIYLNKYRKLRSE